MSGTAADDIIREVVRAGADGYLLKNGPARHLIDAISYVRDGGQYFSPQLRRGGLDRHLLEEIPRVAPEQLPARRATDPQRLRERLREDNQTKNLEERDYEILGMMAENIRPLIDRLDEIEGRIGDMETGETPVPGNVRGWLDHQIADTFADSRSSANSGNDLAIARTSKDLEARLPQLIEQAVTARFHNMASKLQQEIEATHVRTLETFVRNIQVKLVQRVSALETDMSQQAEAMHQLREYSQRTEDNLSRLISGVDRLVQELPKQLAAPEIAPPSAPEPRPGRRRSSRSFSPKIFWMVVAAVLVVMTAALQLPKLFRGAKSAAPSAIATAAGPAKVVAPPVSADTRTKLQAAEEYTERKDYSMAEDIYKQVLKTEPNNVDAMKALASVLYREDKIEESAAILDKLPRTN